MSPSTQIQQGERGPSAALDRQHSPGRGPRAWADRLQTRRTGLPTSEGVLLPCIHRRRAETDDGSRYHSHI